MMHGVRTARLNYPLENLRPRNRPRQLRLDPRDVRLAATPLLLLLLLFQRPQRRKIRLLGHGRIVAAAGTGTKRRERKKTKNKRG